MNASETTRKGTKDILLPGNGARPSAIVSNGRGSSAFFTKPRRKPLFSPERLAYVLSFIREFDSCYPGACEGDQVMYRDLLRALLGTIDDEQKCEAMLLKYAIPEFSPRWCDYRACRQDLGAYEVRLFREAGIAIRLQGGTIYLGPKDKINAAVKDRLRRHKEGIRSALLAEIVMKT